MRRWISLILALVLLMAMPCAALAVKSPGDNGHAPVIPDEPPKTGDTGELMLWLILLLLSLLALIALVWFYNRGQKRHHRGHHR